MSNIIGMDVEAARQLGNKLKVESRTVSTLASTINMILGQLMLQWQGADALQFKGQWEQQHRPALIRLAADIDTMSQTVLNNATAQEQVSSEVDDLTDAEAAAGLVAAALENSIVQGEADAATTNIVTTMTDTEGEVASEWIEVVEFVSAPY